MRSPAPVAAALWDRRVHLGLSRAEIGRRVQASRCTVRTWEVGERRMTLAQAYTYAAVLGMRPALRAGAREPVPLSACPDIPNGRVPPVVAQLRATRLARELSHPAIAAMLGAAPTTPVYWETGSHAIPLNRAHDYAGALGLVLALEEIPASVPALVEAARCPSPSSAAGAR